MTRRLDLSLPAIPESIRKARDEVARIALSRAKGPIVDDVRLCTSEAVTNVVRHAYTARNGRIHISVDLEADELTVSVRDEGDGLTEFRREGELGYGLRIIDALTSRFTISSAPDSGTEVVMVFGLDPSRRRSARVGAPSGRTA
jgi:anti-sigma regulatory factor (Ser/Thr protein kinase)